MSALKIIVTVIYCIVAIAFTASVLMQEGKSAGLGAIGGMAAVSYTHLDVYKRQILRFSLF